MCTCGLADCIFFVTEDLIPVQYGNRTVYECYLREEWYNFRLYIWPWIDFVLYSGMPSFILLVCNIGIIAHVTKAALVHMRKPKTSLQASTSTRITTTTAILMTVSIVFLVLTGPSAIFFIMQSMWVKPADPETPPKVILFYTCVSLLSYVNNSINFMLYCVSGRKFRNEFKLVFQRKRVHPTSEIYMTNVLAKR